MTDQGNYGHNNRDSKRRELLMTMLGSDLLVTALHRLGLRTVFGIPGTQTVVLFEALRRSDDIRTILANDERDAGFMAYGHYRSSGQMAAVITIPGPGLTNTLTSMGEAREDSVAILHIVTRTRGQEGRVFGLQPTYRESLCRSVYKQIFLADQGSTLLKKLVEAVSCARTGEPGPVLLIVDPDVLGSEASGDLNSLSSDLGIVPVSEDVLAAFERRISDSSRIAIMIGQGVQGAASELAAFAERLGGPIISNCSGRGAISEDHPLVVASDFTGWGAALASELFETSDLVIVLGCKLSHNGSSGFEIDIPSRKLVRIDTSSRVLEADYSSDLPILGSCEHLLSDFLKRSGETWKKESGWASDEIQAWKNRFKDARAASVKFEGALADQPGKCPSDFFESLRTVMPHTSCLVVDSGQHQLLARRYFKVLCPRGFIVPADFQSMGGAVAMAIGARAALPELPVVALLGDGGFCMSGFALAVAVREQIPLTVIVFSDGVLAQIRYQQLWNYGRAFATRVPDLDIGKFAEAIGANYECLDGPMDEILRKSLSNGAVNILELRLVESASARSVALKAHARESIRQAIPQSIQKILRKFLGK